MTSCRYVVCLVLMATSTTRIAVAQNHAEYVQHSVSPEPLRYLFYSPSIALINTDASFPLVLFLHGGGEGGDDIQKVKTHGLPKLIAAGKTFPFFVVSPQNPSETQFWDDQQLIRLVDEIVAKHPIDESRIYVTGLSRGGYGAWRLAIQNPNRFAALVPISGGGSLPYVKRLKDVPTWVFHGERDPVIPVEESRRLVDSLRKAGGNAKLTIYPEAKHDAWTTTYENSQLSEWMLKQRRGFDDFTIILDGLRVTRVASPPSGPSVRIAQTLRDETGRDETGPTSFRNYASRTGKPTKTDTLAYEPVPGRRPAEIKAHAEAHYFYRDRDLGQTFTTGATGFSLGAITVRLQPVDVGDAAPGAKVSVQLMSVKGSPKINDNKTADDGRPPYKNPRWATYAFTWPDDPNDKNMPNRRPFKHYSDDFIEGETYEHVMLASGGIIPEDLTTNDYLRFEFSGPAQYELHPNTAYALLFLFDEPAPKGVQRSIPLSNINVLPGGQAGDPFPGGHAIRRDGSSTVFDEVFIKDLNDKADVAASRALASFPSSMAKRLAIRPGTLGYPDVDTYRDLYFILEETR